jgi:hypothetical protein
MIRLPPTKHAVLPLIVLLLVSASLACGSSGGEPEDAYPTEITVDQDIAYGPGPFDFPDPRAGLAELSSYTATLAVAFDGTRAGQAETWSKTYVLLTTAEPPARQLTLEKSSDSEPLFMAELDGAEYAKTGQAACETTAIQPGNTLADRFEPASFLNGVFGADEAGNETVNDVVSNHYIFDQRALGEDGITESSGELWVASEGGYLVKYVLIRQAGADYFGEGIEGTLTLKYDLTGVNLPASITLPEDCPPGFVDAPRLLDANNISDNPGELAYDTSTTIADAAAFYRDNLPALGWEPQDEPSITEAIAILTYHQGDNLLFIVIKPGDTKTRVQILVSKPIPLQ